MSSQTPKPKRMPVYRGKPKATREKLRALVIEYVDAHGGTMPTLTYCREKLGGGSPNTINRHLQALAIELGYERRRQAPLVTLRDVSEALVPVLEAHSAQLKGIIDAALDRIGQHMQSMLSNEDMLRKAIAGLAMDQANIRTRLDHLIEQDRDEVASLRSELAQARKSGEMRRGDIARANANAKVSKELLEATKTVSRELTAPLQAQTEAIGALVAQIAALQKPAPKASSAGRRRKAATKKRPKAASKGAARRSAPTAKRKPATGKASRPGRKSAVKKTSSRKAAVRKLPRPSSKKAGSRGRKKK